MAQLIKTSEGRKSLVRLPFQAAGVAASVLTGSPIGYQAFNMAGNAIADATIASDKTRLSEKIVGVSNDPMAAYKSGEQQSGLQTKSLISLPTPGILEKGLIAGTSIGGDILGQALNKKLGDTSNNLENDESLLSILKKKKDPNYSIEYDANKLLGKRFGEQSLFDNNGNITNKKSQTPDLTLGLY